MSFICLIGKLGLNYKLYQNNQNKFFIHALVQYYIEIVIPISMFIFDECLRVNVYACVS